MAHVFVETSMSYSSVGPLCEKIVITVDFIGDTQVIQFADMKWTVVTAGTRFQFASHCVFSGIW